MKKVGVAFWRRFIRIPYTNVLFLQNRIHLKCLVDHDVMEREEQCLTILNEIHSWIQAEVQVISHVQPRSEFRTLENSRDLKFANFGE